MSTKIKIDGQEYAIEDVAALEAEQDFNFLPNDTEGEKEINAAISSLDECERSLRCCEFALESEPLRKPIALSIQSVNAEKRFLNNLKRLMVKR